MYGGLYIFLLYTLLVSSTSYDLSMWPAIDRIAHMVEIHHRGVESGSTRAPASTRYLLSGLYANILPETMMDIAKDHAHQQVVTMFCA